MCDRDGHCVFKMKAGAGVAGDTTFGLRRAVSLDLILTFCLYFFNRIVVKLLLNVALFVFYFRLGGTATLTSTLTR